MEKLFSTDELLKTFTHNLNSVNFGKLDILKEELTADNKIKIIGIYRDFLNNNKKYGSLSLYFHKVSILSK